MIKACCLKTGAGRPSDEPTANKDNNNKVASYRQFIYIRNAEFKMNNIQNSNARSNSSV